MSQREDESQVGSGTAPDGSPVTYWEIKRPATIGAKGSLGLLIEARDAKGKRITHSDTLKGLEGAGYKLAAPAIEDELAS